MSTSAERQRRRRARLAKEGYVDVSVSVLREHRAAITEFAKKLQAGRAVPASEDRLRPAIQTLKSMQEHLQRVGVIHAGIFGSTARGDGNSESDIDVIIDIDVERVRDILNYVKVCEDIKSGMGKAFPGTGVDVSDIGALKPSIHDDVARDVIYAF
ncbi:MAG: nucleotidyltransferase domain-containing protein [Alphaproteobacteria bacterium]|nr:nucleotidyltransferase domain-containing protein [Alphaproteobacteria bacterium]